MNGWVKLHTRFLDWEWYSDINTKCLFIHLLLNANWKDTSWRGVELKRGQLPTGLHALSEQTGLSVQKIRTGMSKLESTREITKKTTNRFTVITVCNYDKYQSRDSGQQQTNNKQITNKQQHLKTIKTIKTIKTKTIKDIDQNQNHFDLFWAEYPRKVGKKRALMKWKKVKISNGNFEKIMNSLREQKKTEQWEDVNYIPHPATWIYNERWNDEIEAVEVVKCRRCQYYEGGKCANLKKRGFDPSKCTAFIKVEGSI